MKVWLGFAGAALAITLAASALRADVRDDGSVFRPDTVETVNKKIADLKEKYGVEVVIQTFAEIPPAMLDSFKKAQTERKVPEFFRNWLKQLENEKLKSGIYVLITKKPSWVQTDAAHEIRQTSFSDDNLASLREQLRDQFRRGNFDNGMNDAIDYVENEVRAYKEQKKLPTYEKVKINERPDFTPPESAKGLDISGWFCTIVMILGAFWIVIGLIRAFTRMGRPEGYAMPSSPGMPAPGPMYGGGGGGFMSSLIGGMFGAAAGNWMYDSFFRGGQSSGFGKDYHNPLYDREPSESRFTGGTGGDFDGEKSGSTADEYDGGAGGDFDAGGIDAGGGGDYGDAGGDFGGGDFGGGDDGGGGDY